MKIVYRLHPYDSEERLIFLGERHLDQPPKLPEYPTRRDLVEHVAAQAREEGISYTEYLAYQKYFDHRYHNIACPK